MISMEARVRKWGNSMGIIIPKEEARLNELKIGETVKIILVKKNNVLKRMFGSFKFNEPIEKIMRDSDRMLYDY